MNWYLGRNYLVDRLRLRRAGPPHLLHTYSWGNDTEDDHAHWWPDRDEDKRAAQQWISVLSGLKNSRGPGWQRLAKWGTGLEDAVDFAFYELAVKGSPSDHAWRPWCHCKHESERLLQKADLSLVLKRASEIQANLPPMYLDQMHSPGYTNRTSPIYNQGP